VAHHGLQTDYVVPGQHVFHAADAARIGGDVAADGRRGGAGWVRRVPEALRGSGLPEVVVDDPRLHDGELLLGIGDQPIRGQEHLQLLAREHQGKAPTSRDQRTGGGVRAGEGSAAQSLDGLPQRRGIVAVSSFGPLD
jgi:hypothetical protein